MPTVHPLARLMAQEALYLQASGATDHRTSLEFITAAADSLYRELTHEAREAARGRNAELTRKISEGLRRYWDALPEANRRAGITLRQWQEYAPDTPRPLLIAALRAAGFTVVRRQARGLRFAVWREPRSPRVQQGTPPPPMLP